MSNTIRLGPNRQGRLALDTDGVVCPLCGRRARYRGRRNRGGIFECTDDGCLATVFEVLNPELAERPGGSR
jgi:hypothetical protein